jgi:protein-S-isoprenylcysteine O-methyltransferase Ste14
MSRTLSLLFAILAYAVFFATFLYLICFVGNFAFAPVTVDKGPSAPVGLAIAINVVLIALFGLQHSVMARPAFKERWTRIVPKTVERSVYVLAASAALLILFWFWRPIDAVIWDAGAGTLSGILTILFWVGWATVLLSTFLINHFELFGLQQAWLNLRGREPAPPVFHQPFLYKWVRHPLYLGFILAFWATPRMTAGHLLLAAGMSVYILIAIRHEERDLVDLFGTDYEDYRQRVGMLTPRFRRSS